MLGIVHRAAVTRLAVLGLGAFALALALGCPSNLPVQVLGPVVSGNEPPTLEITDPTESLSISQGDRFLIQWRDTDPDSAARIDFDLIDVATGFDIPLVQGIEENDRVAPDFFTVSTASIPQASYYIEGTISDFVNLPVTTFATTAEGLGNRVVVTVTEPGLAPANTPPQVVVVAPAFNQSVAQDDGLVVVVRPTVTPPDETTPPYDPDSDTTLYLLLDLDDNPDNDDFTNPDPQELILLRTRQLPEDETAEIVFEISVDLTTIPLRPNGESYYIRATITDGVNPPVHAYAAGTINVVQAATGSVDLARIGKTLSGARWVGFNPGSQLGARMISARDFDADGVQDLLMAAQFGNPRNRGNLGEAYLVYGQDGIRYGGDLNVNSVSTTIPGVIFEGPPVRLQGINGIGEAVTLGITDLGVVDDLDGDGRPELLFGLAHVDGIVQHRDDDPCDCPPETAEAQTVAVQITINQGADGVVVTEDENFVLSLPFNDFFDTTIDTGAPNTAFGTDQSLEWGVDENGTKYVLLKFEGVLDIIRLLDDPSRVQNLSAELTFRVVNTGDDGELHELLTDFQESDTLNSFGGEPQPDVDYVADTIEAVGAADAGFTTVDVTDMVQRLVDGELASVGDDLRFIIVPGEDATDNATVRSKEWSQTDQRPRLTIQYERAIFLSSVDCYPDNLPNNLTDPGFERIWEAVGCAILVSSQNRDNEGNINLDRLADTVVTLELVGQNGEIPPLEGGITAQANGSEPGRIAGSRFQAGYYDFVDARLLNQPPLWGYFGWSVSSMPDLDNDQVPELIFSTPRGEQDVLESEESFGGASTHLAARGYFGSIQVLTGTNYDSAGWRDRPGASGSAVIPFPLDENGGCGGPGSCGSDPVPRCAIWTPSQEFEIFAETPTDWLQDGSYAGDMNLDGVPDILCGAPFNDRGSLNDTGATYVIYGRTPISTIDLSLADDPAQRPPMIRIRGEMEGDQIGHAQEAVLDVNGDRIDDIVLASPFVDFAGVRPTTCGGDFNGDGVVDEDDYDLTAFTGCEAAFGDEVFLGDPCKAFDFNNDRRIDDYDRDVIECLIQEDSPGVECCPADNGFVGIVFGGVTLDGDRSLSQIAGPDLPGAVFYGAQAGHRAGTDVASAGDFNRDGFGDILIAAPGVTVMDENGRTRVGVVYLIFGGTHLTNRTFSLDQVGSESLPGLVFISPYVADRPNEAPPDHVGGVGDLNNDGFDDIAIGITRADFVDETLPQDPNDPGTNPSIGRRPDGGDVYIVYGNNAGSNR